MLWLSVFYVTYSRWIGLVCGLRLCISWSFSFAFSPYYLLVILVSCGCNGRVGCFTVFVILLSCGCNGRVDCFPLLVILVSCSCNGKSWLLSFVVILVSCGCYGKS